MGLPDPTDVAAYDALLAKVTIGGPQPLSAPIVVREYDPEWPGRYAREEIKVRRALGERAVVLEHVGSTSVPGLPAKPIIDMVLEVEERELAAREWKYMQQYADAKTGVVDEIMRRAGD